MSDIEENPKTPTGNNSHSEKQAGEQSDSQTNDSQVRAKKPRGPKHISDSTIHRLSRYLRLLGRLEADGVKTISSKELAGIKRLTPAQVRKDLSFFGSFGTRGLGYPVSELKTKISEILGLDKRWRVAIVGVGNIGSALVGYKEFLERGFDIRLVFDNDQRKIGSKHKGLLVSDIKNLKEELLANEIEIVALAVPAAVAQEITDIVVSVGVRGILTFAPIHLETPENVFVRREDMTMELEYLTYSISSSAAKSAKGNSLTDSDLS